MALVAAYGSDSDTESNEDASSGGFMQAGADTGGAVEASVSTEDSYFEGTDSGSEDSAARRLREAEERLTNREDVEVAGPSAVDLPPPLEVISGTVQPDFLRPEATKPIAKPFHRSRASLVKAAPPSAALGKPRERDIASMAPKLKGQTEADKRGLPAGAVISAAAKKYKPEEDQGIVTAAQVAMLGGQWRPSEGGDVGWEAAAQNQKKGASRAMPVSDFLAKGDGGSLLPRNRQDRRDKERDKRARGQSAIHGWKTEAEMVLRQQQGGTGCESTERKY